ncbi:MAG: ABC transporter permease subunit [Thermoplasmata archaeon]
MSREIFRVASNPATIFALILILVAGTFSAGLGGSAVNAASGLNTSISYNYSGAYRFSISTFNGAGQPLGGVSVTMTFSKSNGTGPPLGTASGVTSGRGFLSLNWTSAPCRCLDGIDITGAHSGATIYEPLAYPPPANLTQLFGVFSVVHLGLLVARPALAVAISNDEGAVPAGAILSYCVIAGPPPSCTPHDLGSVTASPQIFSAELFGPISDGSMVNVSVQGTGGALLAYQHIPFSSLDPSSNQNAVVTGTGARLQSGVATLSFVVALGGVLIGYVAYGRDRLNGSLDPVLALPITRARLMLSRYVGALVAAGGGAALGTLALGLLVGPESGVALPATLWLSLLVALPAEAAMFVGVAFLCAHLTRSGSLLIVTLVLFVAILTLLWLPIILLADYQSGASTTILATYRFSPINPAQVAASIVGYATFNLDKGPPYLFPYVANPGALLGLATFWIALPVVAAWALFTHRD